MSILSVNKKLIKVSTDYSAGSGISIDEGVISVTGGLGTTYSAGDNIDIYEQDEQLYISSKDWSEDIANASANAYNAATAQIPEPQDLSYISSKVDDKLDTTAFTAWQSGQYATDLQTIEGQITNKLDTSSFSDVSGDFLTTSFGISESGAWNDTTNVVQTNSSNWGSETISSYTTAWSYNVPPYGKEVINSLNGLYLSAHNSKLANSAAIAANATNANSAGYAQTVNETYLENQGFTRNLSSEYGTISVVHNNLIESTNSAISRVGYEGFVSSFGNESIGPNVTATFSWGNSVPNTTFNFTTIYATNDTTVTYSANTNLTGEVTVTSFGEIPFSVDVPNATELKVWSNNYIRIKNNVASAADTFETVVGELAWASALPTYEYDNTNKISAINGSAIAAFTSGGGGSEFDPTYMSAQIDNKLNKSEISFRKWGVDYVTAISGKELSARYAVTARNANTAATAIYDENGNYLTDTYNNLTALNEFVRSNSASWGQGGGGGDVPEDVMVETNLEYNAVGEISGYGNSAIAQYGAEKQWLVHDDTIVHVSNSAQYAFGCNISALQRLMGIDETVLWENLDAGQVTATSSYNLSEPFTSFKKIAVAGAASYGGIRFIKTVYTDQVQANGGMAISVGEWGMGADSDANFYCDRTFLRFSTANAGVLTATSPGSRLQITSARSISTNASRAGTIQRIIGIGRKEV